MLEDLESKAGTYLRGQRLTAPVELGHGDELDWIAVLWDNPTMSTSTLDSKKRVVLPHGRPGDVFDIQQQAEGRFLLVRLEKPAPAERMSKAACLEAMRKAPLRPTMTWDELRELTRKP